jgi:Protein of unknown function (DUF1524)
MRGSWLTPTPARQSASSKKKTSSAVQIDHVVALAAAWRTGAKQWAGDLRLFYGNDPLVLLAVDGPANSASAKGDKDAANRLPPNSAYQCKYVAKQISMSRTRRRHGLSGSSTRTCPRVRERLDRLSGGRFTPVCASS